MESQQTVKLQTIVSTKKKVRQYGEKIFRQNRGMHTENRSSDRQRSDSLPIFMDVLSALKTKEEVMDVNVFFPADPQWQNLTEVIFHSPIVRYIGNSLYVSVVTVAIQLVTGAMLTYALVFMRFRGRKALFAIIMGTYMLPTAATYIPSYIILADLNLLNTYTG